MHNEYLLVSVILYAPSVAEVAARAQVRVVRVLATVGQLEPLLPRAHLTTAEVVDRGHEVAAFVGQGHACPPA